MVPAARAMTSRPTSVEPVKATLATSGCSTSRVPTTEPLPTTTWSTPSGMPASRASSARRRAVSGVISAGLTTMVLPVASAGPTFHEVMAMGKFHGTMAATTPRGSWKVMSTPPATGHGRAPVLVHRAGVEVEDLGDHGHLVAALGDGLADVGRLQPGQLLTVLLDLGGEPPQQAGPVGRGHRPPGRAGLERPGHRRVGLLAPVAGDLGDDRLGGRVHHRGRVAHDRFARRRRSGSAAERTDGSAERRRRHQGLEQPGVAGLLGMPLHADHEAVVGQLDRLDDAVVAPGA